MVTDHLSLPRERRYVAFRSHYYFNDGGLSGVLSPDARDAALRTDPASTHLGFFSSVNGDSFLDRMLYVDFKTFLANQNLAYSDRLSMAASIEMRVPYLDDEVADFALRIPEKLKVNRLRGKDILRRSVRGIVPKEIIQRRKAGFGAPIRAWLRGELAPLVNDMLSERWIQQTGIFDSSSVARLLAEHHAGTNDHTYRIWTLLAFAMWHRTYISPD